ncbi:MAG: DUF1761 domain-containing protein [Patescibacteria group bacterium]
MLEFAGINYWAVLVAWVIYCAVGSFWYSPAGFGKQWSKLSGVDIMKLPQQEATRAIMYVVASSLLQAFTLAVVLNSMNAATAVDGFVAGLFIALGLTAATTIGVTFYSRKGWKFWFLNAAFFLLTTPINAGIIGAWQ